MQGWKRPLAGPSSQLAYLAALIWLLGGLAPVLITGAALSMTQGIGMQPVLYLFPALALDWLAEGKIQDWKLGKGVHIAALLLFAGIGFITVQDYFGEWANAPEVRVQYESTMTAAMNYLAGQPQVDTAVSTITPGPFHTPALAEITLPQESLQPRWFDGRGSLLIPQTNDGLLLFSGFAPLPDTLEPYLATAVLQETLPLRPSDADRPIWAYRFVADTMVADWQTWLTLETVQFGTAATLLGYDLLSEQVAVGETIQLITVWQLQDAPPDLRLFTHLVGEDGIPVAQADRLDAPSSSWVAGDWFVQLHQFSVPEETSLGEYRLAVGLYSCLNVACSQTERLAVHQDGNTIGDNLLLTEVSITE